MSEQPSDRPRPAREGSDMSWSVDLTDADDVAGLGFSFGEPEGHADDDLDEDLGEEVEEDRSAGTPTWR